MEWYDDAIILGVRQHGETSAIVEVVTYKHGRHLGLVRNGWSKRMRPLIQMGNRVEAHWWARLDEHLGIFHLEVRHFAATRIMQIPFALYGLQTAAAHLRLLPERDCHPLLYKGLELLVEYFESPLLFAEILVRFEMLLLEELGFSLDLACCVTIENTKELAYLVPETARAGSQPEQPEKLLVIPTFLHKPDCHPIVAHEIRDGFLLTEFFFARHIWEPRRLVPPSLRAGFIKRLLHQLTTAP